SRRPTAATPPRRRLSEQGEGHAGAKRRRPEQASRGDAARPRARQDRTLGRARSERRACRHASACEASRPRRGEGRLAVSDELNPHSLSPAQPRQDRKRVGRGLGSGKGRYSGRGIKGQKSRAGSHKLPVGFEGGQMPIDMRLGKLRGNTSADAMPIGPFRTYNQPVNVGDLEQRFEAGADVTLDALKAAGLISKLSVDVKVLGEGELTKKLSVTAHSFSKSAVEKI